MDKETILVVEDNSILRDGLNDILAMDGYTVIAAAHGLEALEQMSTIVPDLILSDIAMPEMDGFQFFEQVRSHPEWVSIPFIFLTARGEKDDILAGKHLGVEDYLIKPLTREELLTAVRGRLERSHQLRVAQLHQAYEASLIVLANAIDVRDQYTRGHVDRVACYAQAIAVQIGMPEKLLEHLRLGAILHDIGKIIIPESILLKPGSLSEEEWQEVHKHPLTGAEMVKNIPYLAPAMPVIRWHHERWDSQGYPDGLSGEGIPLGARCVAVADSFDAITTHRSYRAARSLVEGCEEILRGAGSRYDPAVTAAFKSAWEAGQIAAIHSEWLASSNG
jgi:putative two-component system response regulator